MRLVKKDPESRKLLFELVYWKISKFQKGAWMKMELNAPFLFKYTTLTRWNNDQGRQRRNRKMKHKPRFQLFLVYNFFFIKRNNKWWWFNEKKKRKENEEIRRNESSSFCRTFLDKFTSPSQHKPLTIENWNIQIKICQKSNDIYQKIRQWAELIL